MKTLTPYILFWVFLFLSYCLPTHQTLAQKTNYESYALYLYNFIKYTEWPAGEVKNEVVVGVLGNTKFTEELQKVASSRTISGRKITIKQVDIPSQAVGCHVLYLPSTKSAVLREALTFLSGKSTLIVTEREGLARKGACISFYVSENEDLSFEVSQGALSRSRLKIASRLLALGTVVN